MSKDRRWATGRLSGVSVLDFKRFLDCPEACGEKVILLPVQYGYTVLRRSTVDVFRALHLLLISMITIFKTPRDSI